MKKLLSLLIISGFLSCLAACGGGNPAAFASSLEGLIEEYQPILWIHGHTHDPFDYELFATRVVCNPRGYPGEHLRNGFRPDFTLLV